MLYMLIDFFTNCNSVKYIKCKRTVARYIVLLSIRDRTVKPEKILYVYSIRTIGYTVVRLYELYK